jgi:hypothetical protein
MSSIHSSTFRETLTVTDRCRVEEKKREKQERSTSFEVNTLVRR